MKGKACARWGVASVAARRQAARIQACARRRIIMCLSIGGGRTRGQPPLYAEPRPGNRGAPCAVWSPARSAPDDLEREIAQRHADVAIAVDLVPEEEIVDVVVGRIRGER